MSHGTPDAPPVATCGGDVPAFASVTDGELVARCGAIEVHALPLADGIVKLRYAAAGAPERRSWAVVHAEPDLQASIGGDGGVAALCTGELAVAIDSACKVTARRADGTLIVEDALPFDGAGTLVRTVHDEHVYGLGERTGGLDRRGQRYTFWNTDAYDPAFGGWKPGQDPMYQSIPFAVHLAGGAAFGVFTDETRRMTLDLGGPVDTLAAPGTPSLAQYVIAGPAIGDVVRRYVALTGAPALPPRWALGFHQSRWGYPDAATLEAIADRFRAEQIPADALWLDIQHLRGFRSFTVDDTLFPPAMFGTLASKGFHTVAIEDPGIKVDPGWAVYDSGLAGGHFLSRGGVVYQGTGWAGASAFPDLSRAATRAWWGTQVASIAARGVSGIWLDVNEPTTFPEGGGGNSVPDDLAVDGDGEPATMAELHNAYALFEARATFEAVDAVRAHGDRPFVLTRAGYAGIQRYAAAWTGDTPSSWDGLAQTLPMLLGMGISGEPFVGSDIGGYSGHATAELYARWLALGTISPFSRAHVTQGVPGQEPWMFTPEVTGIARARIGDRYQLLPYLYSVADEAARTGAPVLRPLVWAFPTDATVATLGDEALFGPSILAAPIVTQGATSRSVYLPAGRWYELHSGAIIDGPTTLTTNVTLAALPLYARAGAIIPRDEGGNLVIDVYPDPAGPSQFTLYEDAAGTPSRTTITATPVADGIHVAIDHTEGPTPARTLTVRIRRVDHPLTGVDGAVRFTYDAGDLSASAQASDAAHVALAFHYDPAITDPKPPVAVAFEIHAPTDTPQTTPLSVVTSADSWSTFTPLTWTAPGVAKGTVMLPRGEWFDYKLTRGSWLTVEKLGNCGEAPNRYRFGTAALQVDTVANWRDRCGN